MFGSSNSARRSASTGTMLSRLKSGLSKTRQILFTDLDELIGRKKAIDAELLEEIETRLLMADLGVEASGKIINALTAAQKRDELKDFDQLLQKLESVMVEILEPVEAPLEVTATAPGPAVILVVGVNGVGKTTTIGKMTRFYKDNGVSVLLAAGDTFRAAAIEQIQEWGRRTSAPVVAQATGSDSAAVIFDALQSARANNIDLVIADTAGRLHNKDNLMQELGKIRRTINKFDPAIPVEVMLVLDAGTGQNALAQAGQFNDIVTVSGITLTKLDGTAKGGVLFSIAHSLSIPVRFIGVGEQADDLRPFAARAFVKALLDTG